MIMQILASFYFRINISLHVSEFPPLKPLKNFIVRDYCLLSSVLIFQTHVKIFLNTIMMSKKKPNLPNISRRLSMNPLCYDMNTSMKNKCIYDMSKYKLWSIFSKLVSSHANGFFMETSGNFPEV